MFNKDKEVEQLKQRIKELETQLNEVANDNGSVIIKQLPNGQIELNGIQIDNEAEVEYYNSSKATYGELTMFRIGKETKQREMDKLISTHMDEIDSYKNTIRSLERTIDENNFTIESCNDALNESQENIRSLNEIVENLKHDIANNEMDANVTLQATIDRYESMVSALNEDIEKWKERYLKINNISLTGEIITKYGKILND